MTNDDPTVESDDEAAICAALQYQANCGERWAEAALALIDRLRSRSAWQPIETAPKDGTALFWVLAKSEDEAAASSVPYVPHAPYVFHGRRGHWSCVSKSTHWMPLPSPPESI